MSGNIEGAAALHPIVINLEGWFFPARRKKQKIISINLVENIGEKHKTLPKQRQDICSYSSGGRDARFETSHAEKPGELWSASGTAFFLDTRRAGHGIGRRLSVRNRAGLRRDLSFTDSVSWMFPLSP
jgi:hypothetical protein